ncbi:MAG TPA: ABC transporter ATP-binding protein [Gemmatirosa sp.]
MATVVSVDSLSKMYRLGGRPTSESLRDAVVQFARAPIGSLRRRRADEVGQELWALRDVSFDISDGDVVGFIGHNGAGKSTLLKVLARIVEPTSGRVQIRGRVGSLLEVGTGFHPDLTGRENVFLNGALLGMRRVEIARRFDEIVAFSELERFLDTPVKRYSSGMYMRLAFAVAAHLEPEVLIVDEVLAVGDIAFQKKCLGKMMDVARHGRTVLFVSHNLQAIANLCSRALLLSAGRIVHDGAAAEVIDRYYQALQTGQTARAFGNRADGDNRIVLSAISVDQHGADSASFRSDAPVDVEMQVRVTAEPPFEGLVIGFSLFNSDNVEVLSSYYDDLERSPPGAAESGVYDMRCTIPAHLLQEGTYRLIPNIAIAEIKRFAGDEHAVEFSVSNVRGVGSRWQSHRWRRSVLLPYLPWVVEGAELPIAAHLER